MGKVIVRAPASLAPAALSGAFVVTGGTGALGSVVGTWMLQQRVRRVVLVSRSGAMTQGAAELISTTAGFSACVCISSCDASSAEDVSALLRGVQPHLAGVVHSGGVLADATIAKQSLSSMRAVLAPKQAAFARLEAALHVQPTQHSVLFSSAAALMGSAGQSSYAASNAWLDAEAARKQAAGLPVISVQFGAWKGAGMAASSAEKLEGIGMTALSPASGLAALQVGRKYVSSQCFRHARPAQAHCYRCNNIN